MIVIIGGEKGGTGKTTLATNLAALRVMCGKDVLLVDTDKQESANYWAYTRKDNLNISANVNSSQQLGGSIIRVTQDPSKQYEDIIVDAGGRNSSELRATMTIADSLFIPVQPSQFDIWTLARMDKLVDLAQRVNPKLGAYIIINRASNNPTVSEAYETIKLFNDYENLEFSGLVFKDRIAYRKAASQGLSVCELKPPDLKAVDEMKAFYKRVYHEEPEYQKPSSRAQDQRGTGKSPEGFHFGERTGNF